MNGGCESERWDCQLKIHEEEICNHLKPLQISSITARRTGSVIAGIFFYFLIFFSGLIDIFFEDRCLPCVTGRRRNTDCAVS